jgi:uncharacterized protein
VGTEKISGALEMPPKHFHPNTPVTFMIIAKTPMGYKVIVDHRYEGMIYANEIFEDVRVGQIKNGFVKQLRPDGKLDLSLQMIGKAKASNAADKIYEMLRKKRRNAPLQHQKRSRSDPKYVRTQQKELQSRHQPTRRSEKNHSSGERNLWDIDHSKTTPSFSFVLEKFRT